jgi:proteasome assembly chaperone (PAC2) family protein
MIDYLIQRLAADRFARIDPDNFHRYDDSRPVVRVQGGQLKEILPPEMAFYTAHQEETGRDSILFKGSEPHLRWSAFAELISALSKQWGVRFIIALGGLQDNVLHTDALISGFASNPQLLERLKEAEVVPTDYQGPGAIHSLILQEAQNMGMEWISLWGHCPFYLQGTHLRLLSRMANILTEFSGVEIDTSELEKGWMRLARQIQGFIDDNPELQNLVKKIMKAKTGESPTPKKEDGKVIFLDDFLRPKS